MAITFKTSVKNLGADFETKESFYSKCVVINTKEKNLSSAGIILDSSGNNTIATSTDEDHVFIIGGTGNGKTRRVIIPSIFSISKTGNSMVLTDPKGELYRQTAFQLKESGYEIMTIDLRNPGNGKRWNPLGIVEKLYRSGDRESVDTALVMLKDIADTLTNNVSKNDDKYWGQAASSVFMGCALAILEYGKRGTLTFENISFIAHEFADGFTENNSFARSFFVALPPFSLVRQNLLPLYQPEVPRTVQNIASVFDSMLHQYTNQYALMDFLSRSEVDFSTIGEHPAVLYIILPDDSTALYPLASIMIKQLYSILLQEADANVKNHGVLNNKVTFLLDEFGTLCGTGNAFIPDFPVMMTAARSRGIRFTIVCQSVEQLRKNYSTDEANTISSNCKVWIYMNSRDYDFLTRLQNLVGNYSSPYSGNTHPLLSISDLQKMPLGEVLILNNCCGPYIGHLEDFTSYDFGFSSSKNSLGRPKPRKVFERPRVTIEELGTDVVKKYKEKEEKIARQRELERIKMERAERVSNPDGPESFIIGVKEKQIPSVFQYPSSRNRDYSIIILDEILGYRKWRKRETLVRFADELCTKAQLIKTYPKVLKDVFREALNKVESLSWNEMKEIIQIIESDCDDDDDYNDDDEE